ncbi:MAG: hypothetical protein PHD54_12990, partial [Desulfuromonadaceae bacterium]|nr:hypothetical protein [Desulfuromonadaceae bacterium]
MISTGAAISPVKSFEHDNKGIVWDLAVSPSGTGLLELSGELKPGWLGRLSSHLSRQKINIRWGTARKCGSLSWVSSFEIEDRQNHTAPFRIFDPLPAFTAPDQQIELPSLKISGFKIERSTLNGGCIYTEISGKDCIGFLYGILRIFSFYSLFPTELEISTKGTAVFDRFWLKGTGGSVPTTEEMSALYERI